MRKVVALSSLLLMLAGPLAQGAENGPKSAEHQQETYENPLVSLLLLPVTLLIKVASLVGGEESTQGGPPNAPESPPR
jgi:hypothetical protein